MRFKKVSKWLKYAAHTVLLACVSMVVFPFTAVAEGSASLGAINLTEDFSATSENPWRLTADSMTALDDGVVVEARGGVRLERDDGYLEADFARYYTTTDWVLLQGNVQVRLGQDEISAQEAEFDLKSGTGWFKHGNVFMAGPHIYFTGEHVTKHFGDSYTFNNAKITACDGPVPAWSFSAEQAQVEIDGYATLQRPSFNIMDASVLFSPYLVLPAKTTRQSGLLAPEAGISSAHGAYYSQPYFWAIDKSHDVTFYGTIMTKAGFMPAIEYRSRTTENQLTWLGLDLLYDSNIVRHDWSDKVDNSDGLVRTNRSRFWLRGMTNGQVGESQWFYKGNVDFASDQNFLREFKNRMTGFNRTQESTFDLFGRDLQEVDQNRVTEGFFYRDWDRFRLTLGGRYEQDTSLGHGNLRHSQNTVVQQLPALNGFLYKGYVLPGLPVELEASLNSTYMYRVKGTKGLRTEIYPKLSLPLDLGYASVLMDAGFRYTLYNTTEEGYTSPISGRTTGQKQSGQMRFLPEMNVAVLTQASQVWNMSSAPLQASEENVGQRRWDALRHVMQPRIHYSYVARVEQERNPFYIQDDRILPSHALTFGLSNIFTTRQHSVVLEDVPQEKGGKKIPPRPLVRTSYIDILRLDLQLGYDFEEARRTRFSDTYKRKPWMDATLDVELYPTDWLSFSSQNFFSMHGRGFTRNDLNFTLRNKRWGDWTMGYSHRSKDYDYLRQMRFDNKEDMRFSKKLDLLNNTVNINLNSRFSLHLEDQTNLRTGKNHERRFAISFNDDCYRVTGRYLTSKRERSFYLSVELRGLFF